MIPNTLDGTTLEVVRHLARSNYLGRDELYAAADALDNSDREQVCRRLAEFLAGQAIELEQVLIGCGASPVELVDDAEISERYLFDRVKLQQGSLGVIQVAEKCEQAVRQEYDRAVQDATNQETIALLERQRKDVEFGEHVLRAMRKESFPDETH